MIKLLATVIAGSAMFAATAVGQNSVTATTKSAQNPIVANSYLRADVRHYTLQTFENDKVVSTSPSLAPRIELGTKLLDEKLDIFYSLRFVKLPQNGRNAQEETLKMTQPAIWAEYDILGSSDTWGTAGPFAYIFPKFSNSAEKGYVGLVYNTPDMKYDVGIGALSFTGITYASIAYNHKENNRMPVEVKSDNLGLAEGEEAPKTKERNQTYEVEQYAAVDLGLAKVQGLSFGGDIDWVADYAPKYSVLGDDEEKSEMDGYSTEAEVLSSLFLKYKFTPTLSLANNFYVKHTDFYKTMADEERYTNRLRLVYYFM
jgi:hypothetical protein